ncbi:MAG: outer membrane protein assembly factor BamA [Halieaceae bacterium]
MIRSVHLHQVYPAGVLLLCLLLTPLGLAQAPSQAPVQAQEERFVISDIRVEGLQRISAGSVFSAMPIGVGDTADTTLIRSSARALFGTGNFDDIQIGRDGNVLVIIVAERPSISEIVIQGNEAIETEALLDGLKGAGLSEGRVFKRSTLEGMQLELQRQYVQQGRYDANIDAEVIPEPRNRVSINIDVDEGNVSTIKHINIVGNTVYKDEDLTDLFELHSTNWLSFIRGDDKYSRERLSGDLETLTSYYMDRGYLQFRIDSTQVAVSPAKDAVYITANVVEGDVYTISDVDLSGDLVLPAEDLRRFLIVREGQTYSQQLVTSTEEYLTQRLGNEGYNFAKVTGIPEIDEEEKQVAMKFFVDPGKRTYVRRISFRGNTKTVDEVLRREMRQMEGAPASAAAIESSRIRLERLGFFSQASVETPEVAGHDDLIDVEYTVEEQSSGSIGASFGYAQGTGLILGLNLQQDNFLGTGKRVGIGANSSQYQDFYNFSYTNPYFTEDGVSRGFNIFYRATDLDEINVARYSTNTFGGAVNFGYPIRETERLGFSIGLSNTDITVGRFAVQEIKASPRLQGGVEDYYESTLDPFTGTYSAAEVLEPLSDLPPTYLTPTSEPGFIDINGDSYLNWTITSSWSQSTLNRGRFATRGASNSVSLEVSMPASDLEFYKLVYRGEYYWPIAQSWTVKFRTELGWGDGYGDTSELPFYENFFAGGFGSVRGYESNTLGPQSTPALLYDVSQPVTAIDANGEPTQVGGPNGDEFGYVARNDRLIVSRANENPDPFGGDVLLEGGVELIFPLPFIKDQRQIRSAFFIDAGNVFSTNCRSSQRQCYDVDLNEMRYSVGVGATWITGFGPITFSLAKPLNSGDFDQEEVFQFTLGRGF